MDVITNPCPGHSKILLIKRAQMFNRSVPFGNLLGTNAYKVDKGDYCGSYDKNL